MPLLSKIDRLTVSLAVPNIMSGVSTALLGFVDLAVVGHLPDSAALAGLALALGVYHPCFFVFMFLRTSTVGLTAQAFGARDREEIVACAVRGVGLGLCIGSVMASLCLPLAAVGFRIVTVADPIALERAHTYFYARMLGAPAALANYAVQGWLTGVQETRKVLMMNVVLNVSNFVLCIILGLCLHFGVTGVGLATSLANYTALACGLWQISALIPALPSDGDAMDFVAVSRARLFDTSQWTKLVVINTTIFFRSACLMLIITCFVSWSGSFGVVPLAANNILIQLQILISSGMDGFANAAEAMVGEAIGAGEPTSVRSSFFACFRMSSLLAIAFTGFFFVFDSQLLSLLTSRADVYSYAMAYSPWNWVAPLISFVAYLMDGVYVGATMSKEMRDSMLLATASFFASTYFFGSSNTGLWCAFFIHYLVRGAFLLLWYPRVEEAARRNSLLGNTLL
eukprot:TRINITY_DN31072_c0_g1_i1.p1 TRINITY_DN31072_c0_g1~~TRINITY_DN31072_c0_g1_i1.p1  ORF type:complete len:455 (-),score=42.84 TRINITY_DN31072_c0_g1_i1:42-1406(-)